MTFLPIVGRELRVASRRRGAWWTRVIAAFLAIAIGTFVLLVAESDQRPAAVGNEMFTTVAGFLFLYTAIAGALVTCDCLAEEKREGTMGLLFLTDLKGYDVVFGKLAATSLNTIYGMLAVVPLMAIPILMGGVASAEFWRVVIVAINLLMFSLAVGILASSLSRNDHRAMLLAFLIIAGLVIVPWLSALRGWGTSRRPAEWLMMFSPAIGCFTAFDSIYKTPKTPVLFWSNMGCTQLYFWVFILIACRVVPRSWQETGERFESRGMLATIRAVLEGSPLVRAARRRRLLELNPYLWRAARRRTKDLLAWGGILLGIAFWYVTRPKGMDTYFDVGLDFFVVLVVHAVFKWWVAAEASRHLSEDRRSGGLELLLSTPLRADEILSGQRRAIVQQFGGPIAAVLVADFILMLMAIKHGSPDERAGYLMFYVGIAGFLLFDLFALTTVGMWLGLSGRKTNRATIVGLLRIVVVPSAAFAIIMALVAIVSPQKDLTPKVMGLFWVALCTVSNLVFIASANNHLKQFRDVVAERFATKRADAKAGPPAVAPPKLATATVPQP